MICSDYHLHSNFSVDSDTEMELMIKKAISLGLKEIAFTDHQDYLPDGSVYEFNIDYKAYVSKFEELKCRYEGQIRLVLGVEIGMMPKFGQIIRDFVSSYPFEFVIGSSHDTSGLPHYAGKFCIGKEKKAAYNEYFAELYEEINIIDDFDVLGHFDYISRYWINNDNELLYKDYADIIDQILLTLIQRGKGLELNTSGIRYGLGVMHPQQDILKRYRQLGGEIITVGSDAHRAEHIHEYFDAAKEQLKSAGFTAYALFRERKPIFVKI